MRKSGWRRRSLLLALAYHNRRKTNSHRRVGLRVRSPSFRCKAGSRNRAARSVPYISTMHVAHKQNRLPKYRRAPERFGRFAPTTRDLRILQLVHDYRYLTAEQVTALLAPGSPRQIARRLQGLFHHGFLARLLPPLRVRTADDTRPTGSPRVTYGL